MVRFSLLANIDAEHQWVCVMLSKGQNDCCAKFLSTASDWNLVFGTNVRSGLATVTSLAVNVGGSVHGKYEEDTATLGSTAFAAKKHWAASSTGFVPGASFTSLVKSGTPVSGTADQTVYATARTSLGSLRYYATQLRNGDYNVVLSFAEIVYTRDDNLARRVFDIYLQVTKFLSVAHY